MGSYSRKAVAETFSSTYQQWNALVCAHSMKASAWNTRLRVTAEESQRQILGCADFQLLNNSNKPSPPDFRPVPAREGWCHCTLLNPNGTCVVFRLTLARLLLSSECPPLVMPLSQSCKEKLQLQPSLAVLLLPSEGGCRPEKKPLHL